MNHFHFLRPLALALFPLFALLLWLYHRRKKQSRSWQAVCDSELLSYLLVGKAENKKTSISFVLLSLSGALALVALAGPVWTQLEQPVFRDQSALVLVLDLSRSMDATDIAPTRLTRARHKLIDILKQREEGQTALVVYAAESFVVSPLTQDTETIISQVSALKTSLMPEQGSRPDLALEKATQLMTQAGVPRGHILVMTDGLEQVPMDEMESVIASLRQKNHVLSILGLGTAEGAPIKLPKGGFLKDREGQIVIPQLDEAALKRFAKTGGGRYQGLSVDDSDIDALQVVSFSRRIEDQEEEVGLKTDRWREEGPWLLLPLLPLAALAFRRGILGVLLVIFLSLPLPAQALDWSGLWARPDQRAAAAFSEGEASAAAKLFEDPEWKAASHYRNGDYQKSIEALEGIKSSDALYNKGNALAELGQFPEAIAAYDEALKLDPKHEDAQYNREEIQKKMGQKNQNQQEGEPSKDGESSEDSEQSEQDSEQDSSEAKNGQKSDESSDSGEPSDEGEPQEEAQQAGEKNDSPGKKEQGEDTREANKEEGKDSDAAQSEDEAKGAMAQADLAEQDESEQAIEQWLRRIPDDPGGLLRRKFRYQSRQRNRAGQSRAGEEVAW